MVRQGHRTGPYGLLCRLSESPLPRKAGEKTGGHSHSKEVHRTGQNSQQCRLCNFEREIDRLPAINYCCCCGRRISGCSSSLKITTPIAPITLNHKKPKGTMPFLLSTVSTITAVSMMTALMNTACPPIFFR